MIRPELKLSPAVKIMFNIGALLDIPTGYYLTGKHGESILNGGLGMLTGITGIGNNFKSTIMHYMMLSAASKVNEVSDTYMSTYDTEINIHEHRLINFTYQFDNFRGKHIINEGMWAVTDKTVYFGNKWYEEQRQYLKDKAKCGEKDYLTTPFLERDGITMMKVIPPSFGEIDSLTEFDTEDIGKIQDENELGEAGGNTLHMRQGLAKTRMLMELPTLCGGANHFMLLSAHFGKDMAIQAGPYAAPPTKKLQHLKPGDKVKGVTDKFLFLTSNFWQVFNASPLLNDSTKGPEYPVNSGDPQPGNADLNIVTIKLLRSKSGPSGATFDIIVSQAEGVLPSLTEFHYIKNNKRYGMDGNLQNFHLALYPELNLTRPTIRSKINSDPLLRRALNITAELCQITNVWRHLDSGFVCEPAVLKADLEKLGYDWKMLLSTRGYWTFNNDKHPVPFLSTMDLLNIRAGKYHPYWLEDDKKTLKKGYSL